MSRKLSSQRYLISVVAVLAIFAVATCALAQTNNIYDRPEQNYKPRDYDALHYRIHLQFDHQQKAFTGENRIKIRSTVDRLLACELDAETFTVTGVTSSEGSNLRYEQQDGILKVNLTGPLARGEEGTFTVHYGAKDYTIDSVRFGMAKNYPIGLSFLPADERHPRLIQALSFPTGARHWFPCNDHPSDKATQEVLATVDDGDRAIANGRLVGITPGPGSGKKTFHWSLKKPHSTYLSVLMVGPYVEIEDKRGSVPLGYWVYPKDEKNAFRSFEQTPAILKFFESEFRHEYPWPLYNQITVPGIGGGAEATSATIVGQNIIHDADAEQDFPTHWLVAHEAAHQWWGDLVTLSDWTHTWINESFGTYFEHIYRKHSMGPDEGALDLLSKKDAYLREAREKYKRPIVFNRWEWPNQNFDRHTYQKGANVLNMLRWIIGDDEFRKSVSLFLHQHAYNSAGTKDFIAAVHETTGQDYNWFFDQWLYKAGHPKFDVSYSWDDRTRKLSVSVMQVQETSKWVPVFRTPVVIGIETADRKWSERVLIDEQEEVYEFDCEKSPRLVRFDEGNYLLKEWVFEKTADELLYQLRKDDVIGRLWAAGELSRYVAQSAVRKGLRRAARQDPFWAVRREAIDTLSESNSRPDVDFLKKRCLDEKSNVRVAALRALGKTKRLELVAFFAERFRQDNSYLARAEAIRGVGLCGDKSSLPAVKAALSVESPRNVVANAAREAQKMLME